jgi:hypothetical protein
MLYIQTQDVYMHPTTINDYDYDYDYRKHSIAVNLDLWGSPVPAVQVKRAVPGLMARDYGFFSTQTSLV